MKRWCVLLSMTLLAACAGQTADPSRIRSRGTDSMVDLARAWAAGFAKVDPALTVTVDGGGPEKAFKALAAGKTEVANSRREMTEQELQRARGQGVEPAQRIVGYEVVAVFLNPGNPIEMLSLSQLAEIYGPEGALASWSELGASVPGCQGGEIVRAAHPVDSATHRAFTSVLLGEASGVKEGAREAGGARNMIDLVRDTPCAIGYGALADVSPEVKIVCVAGEPGRGCTTPAVATASSGTYPLARPLFMYSRGEGAAEAYLDWIVGDAGQCLLEEKGYVPVREVICGDTETTEETGAR